MKMRYILTVMLVSFWISLNFAQQSVIPKEVYLKAATTQTGIRLHWTPANTGSFDTGLNGGYSLERFTVSQGGVDVANMQGTKVILGDPINPLPQGDSGWDSDMGTAADSLIYYFDYVPVGSNNLADALAFEQANEDRYQFGMFMSYLDFPTAQDMALAYDDQSVEASSTYLYRLTQLATGEKDLVVIATDSVTQFAAITQVEGTSENGVIVLEWPTDDIDQDYFSFNILRSDDGSNYEAVNDEPYIYFESGEGDLNDYLFVDSTTMYGNTYYYQIEGLTLFGTMGERSEPIEVLSVPYLTNIDPVVGVDTITQTEVKLEWTILNTEQMTLDFISGYNVYRSPKVDTEFELITPTPITDERFTDSSPLSSGYYIIATVDDFGNEYPSLAQFAQLEDTTPPEVPTGLNVRESATAQYEITWDDNVEQDLEGYLVYTQYAGSSTYVMVSNDILDNSTFLYDYPPDLVSDEICFKISAIDNRGNESDMSDCVTVVIPDDVPPARPYMSKHEAIDEGIALGWKFSPSDDVALHELQRKPTGSPGWESILRISPEQEIEYDTTNVTPGAIIASCYIDSSFTELRSYDYRMTAIDSSDNRSYSTIVSLTPLFAGSVGTIENFTVSPVTTSEPGIMPQQDAYLLIQVAISDLEDEVVPNYNDLDLLVIYRIITAEQFNSLPGLSIAQAREFLIDIRDNYWTADMFVTLQWEYENLDQLLYFQVFRSIDGRGFIDYIDILPDADTTTYQFDDGFIMSDHNYLYKVMAAHAGGRFSEISEPLLVRVK